MVSANPRGLLKTNSLTILLACLSHLQTTTEAARSEDAAPVVSTEIPGSDLGASSEAAPVTAAPKTEETVPAIVEPKKEEQPATAAPAPAVSAAPVVAGECHDLYHGIIAFCGES